MALGAEVHICLHRTGIPGKHVCRVGHYSHLGITAESLDVGRFRGFRPFQHAFTDHAVKQGKLFRTHRIEQAAHQCRAGIADFAIQQVELRGISLDLLLTEGTHTSRQIAV